MSRKGTGHLGEEQIAAAYELHLNAGYSTRQLAELLWQRHGYASANSCRCSLRYAFRCRALTLRSRKLAMLEHHKRGVAGARRELQRIVRRETDPEWVTAEYERVRLSAVPELADLIAEQERDERFGMYSGARWMISLDKPCGDGDARLLDFVDHTGHLGFGQRTTPDFADVVCAVVDRRREIDAWAA